MSKRTSSTSESDARLRRDVDRGLAVAHFTVLVYPSSRVYVCQGRARRLSVSRAARCPARRGYGAPLTGSATRCYPAATSSARSANCPPAPASPAAVPRTASDAAGAIRPRSWRGGARERRPALPQALRRGDEVQDPCPAPAVGQRARTRGACPAVARCYAHERAVWCRRGGGRGYDSRPRSTAPRATRSAGAQHPPPAPRPSSKP